MKKLRERSIHKFEDAVTNEDAVRATEKVIAVSDGAGGGGVYADKWSAYLLEHLPEEPLKDFETFDKWVDGIWEAFYNNQEEIAKQKGGMLLNKFYDEGSFATLVAVWKTAEHNYFWATYGDSVAFHYNRKTGMLEHSFGRLADFKNPPYLINYIAPLQAEGYKCGEFETDDSSIVFVASDTLAQYILTMYEASKRNQFEEELNEVLQSHTRYASLVQSALTIKAISFDKALRKLLKTAKRKHSFKDHLAACKRKGLLGHDDYSFASF